MIRQFVLVACFLAMANAACITIGPAVMGTCPPGYTKVNNPEQNNEEQCALPENVAGCTAAPGGGSGGSCTDVVPNCAAWKSTGFCTNTIYTAAQKRNSCAKTCGLC